MHRRVFWLAIALIFAPCCVRAQTQAAVPVETTSATTSVLRPGDLVIAMTEQGEGLLGSSAIIPADGSYLHNQRIGFIENLDEGKLDRGYLYRLFNTPQVRAQIRATASGTKVRHTAPKRIYCEVVVRVGQTVP